MLSRAGRLQKIPLYIYIADVRNPACDDVIIIRHDSFHQFEEHGATAYLQDTYGGLMIAAEDGYDVTLQVDVSALAGSPEEIIFKVASLKRNLFAAVFNKYFQLQASGTAPADGTPTVIKHRPTETMYISAHKDRVTVIFSTIFSDEDDVVFGRLFLQEFAEARVRVCSVCVCACVRACVCVQRVCVCVCVRVRVCVSMCLLVLLLRST